MHELSIATALIEQIEEEAQKNGLKRVDEVELQTGILRQVVPEMMEEAYREVCVGTIAEGSALKVCEIPAKAQCRLCQEKFQPNLDCFLCPSCHKADVDVLEGDKIILAAIQGE